VDGRFKNAPPAGHAPAKKTREIPADGAGCIGRAREGIGARVCFPGKFCDEFLGGIGGKPGNEVPCPKGRGIFRKTVFVDGTRKRLGMYPKRFKGA
jgi:hypothetical protein